MNKKKALLVSFLSFLAILVCGLSVWKYTDYQKNQKKMAVERQEAKQLARQKQEEAKKREASLKAEEEEKARKAKEEAERAAKEAEQAKEDVAIANVEQAEQIPSIAPQEQEEIANEREAARQNANQEASGGGHIVCIDPGHQAKGNNEKEQIGPGAGETKPKVSSGTYGPASGLNEYELNLIVSLQLKEELLKRGYQVVMTRESHDVNISNHERADMAAAAGAEILVRIHANGDANTSVKGALTMAPAYHNPYLSQDIIDKSNQLSQLVVDAYCQETGFKNLGVQQYNTMSGINWAQMPVTIVEMGFMTNTEDDLKMADSSEQEDMVRGMANGIDLYFSQS